MSIISMRLQRKMSNYKFHQFSILLGCGFLYLILLIFTTAKNDKLSRNWSEPSSYESDDKSDWKMIVLGNPYWFLYKSWEKILIRHLNGECPELRCFFTSDQSMIDVAHAVLFYGPNLPVGSLVSNSPLPDLSKKRRDQVWVIMSAEPPSLMLKNTKLELYNSYFNWTMFYRSDADVKFPYGLLLPRKEALQAESIESLIPNEPKQGNYVSWMVSRCESESKREVFVDELREFIEVDIYGGCGMPCGKKTIVPNVIPGQNDPCDDVINKYYFYLALENSICKDYITEKFYRALILGLIPVVMGGISYDNAAPPNSYISAGDFDTLEDMANYMRKITRDKDLYHSYHEWRRAYTVEIGLPFKPQICDLCAKLHDNDIGEKVYTDLRKWFIDDSHCTTWREN